MIIDNALMLTDSDDLDGISASSASIIGDVLDFGSTGKNAFGTATYPALGEGGDLFLHCICEDEDFATGGGSAVITYSLITAANEGLSSSATTLITWTGDKTPNDGDVLKRQKLPATGYKRYLGLSVAVATAALTAGKITTWIGLDSETPVSRKI